MVTRPFSALFQSFQLTGLEGLFCFWFSVPPLQWIFRFSSHTVTFGPIHFSLASVGQKGAAKGRSVNPGCQAQVAGTCGCLPGRRAKAPGAERAPMTARQRQTGLAHVHTHAPSPQFGTSFVCVFTCLEQNRTYVSRSTLSNSLTGCKPGKETMRRWRWGCPCESGWPLAGAAETRPPRAAPVGSAALTAKVTTRSSTRPPSPSAFQTPRQPDGWGRWLCSSCAFSGPRLLFCNVLTHA